MTTRLDEARPWPLLLRPLHAFIRLEASGGILLLLCAVAAIAWANSPWSESYFALWHTHLSIHAGPWVLDYSLHHWINDGLMVIFFFVVGLEIKREALIGELSSPRKAALPMMAALGGMVVPAALYAAFNWGTPAIRGWGVPMATDIAFALGVLALLGRHAPLGLKVFLAALAIADDLGAVLVIALFYTSDLNFVALAIAGVLLLAAVGCNAGGVRGPLPYALIGIVLWLAVLKSGVHATVAGVLLAMTIPCRRKIDAPVFLERAEALVREFADDAKEGRAEPTHDQRDAVNALEQACEQVQTPLHRLEHDLHPWVAFLIVPLFALANAGVTIDAGSLSNIAHPITLGVMVGLVVGKVVGVTLFSWLAVVLRLADLPHRVRWAQLFGVSWLCGIGFTMSLFIAALAFDTAEALDLAKIGILIGSTIAGIVGFALLRSTSPHKQQEAKPDRLGAEVSERVGA